jgi:hypothetical protein
VPKLLCAVVGIAVLSTACNFDHQFVNPLAPAPQPSPGPRATPTPVPQPGATYTVSGLVIARGGAPVAGTTVITLGQRPTVSTTTDSQGRYSLSGVQSTSLDRMSPLLSASSPGFFTGVEFVEANYGAIGGDRSLDFELDALVHIAVGEVVHGQLNRDRKACSHWGYGTGYCARFAIVPSSSGRLEVTVSGWGRSFDYDVVAPDGSFEEYGSPNTSVEGQFFFPVQAGPTYQIRVIPWAVPDAFELVTVLR